MNKEIYRALCSWQAQPGNPLPSGFCGIDNGDGFMCCFFRHSRPIAIRLYFYEGGKVEAKWQEDDVLTATRAITTSAELTELLDWVATKEPDGPDEAWE